MSRRSPIIIQPSASPGVSYPLDDYPGLFWGCSWRKLASGYSGRAFAVENIVSLGLVTDIFFVGDNADESAVVAEADGTDLTCQRWQNQHANGESIRRGNASQRALAAIAGAVPKFNGFSAHAGGRFSATEAVFAQADYPSYILVSSFNRLNVSASTLLWDVRFDFGGRVRLETNGTEAFRLRYEGGLGTEATCIVNPSPINAIQGFIFEIFGSATGATLIVNGVSDSDTATLAPFSNQNNYFLESLGQNNNYRHYELLAGEGRQIGLLDDVNNYYNFY